MTEDIFAPKEESKKPPIIVDPEVNYFGLSNYRNQYRKFGIKIDDRRRHMYIVGKTGMGKTTILENMVLNDIYAGHGVGLVDPHGDIAEKMIDFIPPNRINDVVYFNPADIDYPIGFNILEVVRPEHKHLVASGLMGVFKKIWVDMWSSRMEYILNNTLLALLDFPGTTLLGINRMLADDEYRDRVVRNLKDPVVKAFWTTEFASYNDRYKQEAVAPIQNKIGQFLSASVIRNIVAQVKSRIDIRDIMDSKKIFIMNLSKGRIGEDSSRLLGGMLITKLQLAAMERVDTPEKDRKDFFLYVDEFQNFATESFANILSEARKYRLDLTMAHQYMEQLDETVLAAVIGNVGTVVTFRVGSTDAEILAKEFTPTFVEEDLVNLPKYQIYLKLMIDGVASRPFSALTLPPVGSPTASSDKVIKVSRERYAVPRDRIEDKIARWSGMVVPTEGQAGNMEIDDEETMFGAPKENPVIASPPVGDEAIPQKRESVGSNSPLAPQTGSRLAGGIKSRGGLADGDRGGLAKPFKKGPPDFARAAPGKPDRRFPPKKFDNKSDDRGPKRFPDKKGPRYAPASAGRGRPPLDFSSARPVPKFEPEEKVISLNALKPKIELPTPPVAEELPAPKIEPQLPPPPAEAKLPPPAPSPLLRGTVGGLPSSEEQNKPSDTKPLKPGQMVKF